MKKRILWIDILRIIGILGVILIHVSSNTIGTYEITGTSKTIFDIIHKSCYFTLPLFVMVSGSLLLNKDISYKEIFTKYIRRILLVILIFGSLFAFMEEYYITKSISISLVGNVIKRLVTGDLWAHMWYLYLIIGLYLVTPLFRKWIKNSNNTEQITLLSILYLFIIFKDEIARIFNLQIGFYIPITTGFIFAYLLGNYLYNSDISKNKKLLLSILGITSFVSIILITIFNKGDFLSYTSTLTILVATSVYMFFKDKEITNNNTISKFITTLGECSFGIYIIHQLFINIIYKVLKIDFIIDYPYLGIICYSFVILTLSFIVIYLLRKLKLARKYIL